MPAAEVDNACATLRRLLVDNKRAGRREFLALLGKSLVGSGLLSSLFSPARAESVPVTVMIPGGSFERDFRTAFGDPFTKKTGMPLAFQEPLIFARLRAMHAAHAQQVDVSSSQGREIMVANQLKMTTPLDWKVIDRSALSDNQLVNPNGIGGFTLSLVICYNRKKWPGDNYPKSWKDFWDVEKFPGRRSLRRDETFTLEAALLADGVKEDEFYPLDVDRAFRSLDRIKPYVKVWWDQPNQAQQLVEQDEVDLIALTDGRINEIIDDGAPFGVVWNQAINTANGQTWFVPVGSPNPAGGMKLLDFVGRAETQAVFAKVAYYSPQNPKAYDFIDPKLGRRLATYPENLKQAHITNHEWWAAHADQMQRRFNQWLAS